MDPIHLSQQTVNYQNTYEMSVKLTFNLVDSWRRMKKNSNEIRFFVMKKKQNRKQAQNDGQEKKKIKKWWNVCNARNCIKFIKEESVVTYEQKILSFVNWDAKIWFLPPLSLSDVIKQKTTAGELSWFNKYNWVMFVIQWSIGPYTFD